MQAAIGATAVLDSLSNSGLITIISRSMSAASVSLFSSTRTIANTAMQGVGMILYPLNPDIIRFQARREFGKLDEVFRVCWLVAGSAVNFGMCFVPLVLNPLYRTWTRGKLHLDFPLFAALAAAVAFRAFAAPWMGYLACLNSVRIQTSVSVLRGVVVVGLSIVLLKTWGLFGVGFAWAVAEFVGPVLLAGYCASGLLKRARGGSSAPMVILPAISLGSVVIVYLVIALIPKMTPLLCPLGMLLVAWLGWLQWLQLTDETKRRLTGLIASVTLRLRTGRTAKSVLPST